MTRKFRLGDWEVAPLEGRLIGPDGERHLAPRVMDVLLCLAETPGEVVEREELVRAVWGERAVTDEPLTRAVADLRQALGDRRGEFRYVETIPKRGYRLIAPVEPVEPAGETVATAASELPRRLRVAATAAFVGVLTVLAILWIMPERVDPPAVAPSDGKPGVAVLPFKSLSTRPEDAHFSEGLTETLTHVLAQIDGLKVVARTSAFVFKDRAEDVRTIGAQLGVDAVLEGSVQRDADTLRITTQLVSTGDGGHYWTHNFDRKTEDVFSIQDEIAAAVAAALHVTLLGERREHATRAAFATSSVPAYDAFLEGRRHLARRTSEDVSAAIAHFERALELDPEYTLAWVGLADANLLLHYYGNLARDEMISRARVAIDRALALDPQLGEAYASLGLLHWQLSEIPQAEAALQRAIALEPNYALAYFWLGTVYNDAGRPAEALALHRAALDLDPLAAVIHNAVAVSLEKLGRFDESLEQFRYVMQIDPGYAATMDRAARLNWSALARLDEAVHLQRRAAETDPGHPIPPAFLAELYLDLGDADAAAAWLKRAYDVGSASAWPHRARALTLAYRDSGADERLRLALEWCDGTQSVHTREILLRIARDVWLARDEPDKAIGLYHRVLPALSGTDPVPGYRNLGPAVDLALALARAGRWPEAEVLLAAAENAARELPRLGCCGYGIADVEILVLRGETEDAIDRLEQAVTEGWRQHWWWKTERNPNFANLAGNERLEAVLATLRRETARDRDRLHALHAPARRFRSLDITQPLVAGGSQRAQAASQ